MNRIYTQRYAPVAGIGLLLTLAPTAGYGPARAQNTATMPVPGSQDALLTQWPRQITSGTATLTVYQPQLDRWQGNRLTGRSAVSVQANAVATPVYGVIWFSARTDVDKEASLVTLNDIQITRNTLPNDQNYVRALQQDVGNLARTVPLEQLEANLAITQAEQRQTQQPIRNDPPRILYSNRPAVLVLVDGPPTLRPVAGTNLLRVINTPALLLLDQGSGTYYLYLMDRWMQAASLQAIWKVAVNLPAALETARQAAVATQNVDLMDNPTPDVKQALDTDVVPTVYVSETQAELIQTQGAPNFAPIAGTRLLWAQNSQNSLFLNTADQNYYALISGRWYRSRSLTGGAWTFVAGSALPRDFARIPESHPAGDALPSVPGTTEAKQALIAHNIPQTATVQRSSAHLDVVYDGDPQFAPVEGTTMQYAINTATPVILISPGVYYACQNGAWFTGGAPIGPWTLAASVPPVIYTIPVTSPINYVTNTYVYGATPDAVYVGYTPGYLGTYVEPYGCVVYGSGYRYRPWIGSLWIGAPITYGLGVGFDFNIGSGWSIGFGFGYGPIWHPWWGPWWGDWRWHDRVRWTDNFRRDHGDWRWHDANLNHFNVYHRWPQNIATSRPRLGVRPAYTLGNRGRTGGNTVFAGRDGGVYRRTPTGWEARTGNQWRPLPTSGAASRTSVGANVRTARAGIPNARPETPMRLNSEQSVRALGGIRAAASPSHIGAGAGTVGLGTYRPSTGIGSYRPTSIGAARPVTPTFRAPSPVFRAPAPQISSPFPSMGGSFGGYARRGSVGVPTGSFGGAQPGGFGGGVRAGGFGGGVRGGRR